MSLTVDDGSPVTTDYVWDVNAGLPVVLDDGTNQYVYGLDLISATDISPGTTVYFTTDGLGSTMDITNSSGVKTDGYTYDVFGAANHASGNSSNQRLFTGEQIDNGAGDTGLQYLRARYYDPVTGRFLSRDPIPGGNRYGYASNNPVLLSDPSGLWPGCGRWCNPMQPSRLR